MLATQLVILLPGLPYFPSRGQHAFTIVVEVLLIAFLWRDSSLAWVIAVFWTAFPLAAILFGTAGGLASGVLAVLALQAVALCALLGLRIEGAKAVGPGAA